MLDVRRDVRSANTMKLRPVTTGTGILWRRAELARALLSINDSEKSAIGQCDVKRSAVVPCRRPPRLPVGLCGTAIASSASANTKVSHLRIMSTTCCWASRMPAQRRRLEVRKVSFVREILRINDDGSLGMIGTNMSPLRSGGYIDV